MLSLLTGVTGSKALKMIPIGYIDPSFGSLVFQVIAATILGGILTVRLWWGRVTEKSAVSSDSDAKVSEPDRTASSLRTRSDS